jgi:hypothetical protein
MAELGQTEFTPLYGYFINNKSTTTQMLTFNYKDTSAIPEQRFFARNFPKEGWYSFGIANPSYAKEQGSSTVDIDNPDHILNSLLGVTSNYDSVVDFTNASYASSADAVLLKDPWKLVARSADITNTTEINSLNDFRETKGYAIYIKASTTLTGFQNAATPQCTDGIDNDGDGKTDYPTDFGCATPLDENESNAPAGMVTLTKSSTYANQTVTLPQTAYKIGSYSLTVSDDNYFNPVFGLGLILSSSSPTVIEDVYLVVDSTTFQIFQTGSSSLFWIGEGVFAPGTSNIAVYATLPSTLIQGETITTGFGMAATSGNTGDVVGADVVDGQTITIAQGSLEAAVDASSPISSLVVANSMPKVASYKFTASNDSYTITELTAKVASANDAAAIMELVFKDGATELARAPFSGIYATATGLSVGIPSNSNKVIDVYANLGSIGTGFANSGANVGITLTEYRAQNSGGGESSYGVNLAGNHMYVYKTKPTITNAALPTTVLSGGTQTIYKFTVSADAGGTVVWRKIALNIATSGSAFTVTGWTLYDSANESTALANVSSVNTGSIVTFTSTADQEVSGSKAYVVKAVVTGVATGAISTNITSSGFGFTAPANAATVQSTDATFVWSDESITTHSDTTADWNNDYLVKNLPTESLTLTR